MRLRSEPADNAAQPESQSTITGTLPQEIVESEHTQEENP
jgi:hypothetical protein